MYKVFLNDWRIVITAPGNITLNKPTVHFGEKAGVDELKRWFLSFVTDKTNEVFLTHDRPDFFFDSVFRSVFNQIPAAGGMVIRKNKFLFIYRNDKWDLPKGKIDKRETPEKAALREVKEECGISGHKIVKKLPSTFHIFQSRFEDTKDEWILKETFWYEMEYSGSKNGTPETKENITEIKWFSEKEFDIPLKNTYVNLVPIIQLYRD